MIVDRRGLCAALAVLVRVANPRGHQPNILLQHSQGHLTLAATDTTITATHIMPADGPDLLLSVSAKGLAQVVGPSASGQVEVNADGTVVVDGTRVTIPLADPADFPAPVSRSWTLVAEWPACDLRAALAYTVPVMSRDTTRSNLCALLLDRQQAVATDGHRLHLARLPGRLPQKLVLPATAATVLHRLLAGGDQVRIGTDKELVRFHIGQWLLDTSAMDSVFPDYHQVVPKAGSQQTVLHLHTRLLLEALRRVGQVSPDRHIEARVNGKLCLRASSHELGAAELEIEPVDSTHHGADLTVGFNARYLIDALAGAPDLVQLGLTDALSPARIDRQDNKIGVVMPLRL